MDTAAARAVIEQGIADGVFPAAAIEVGSSAGPMWAEALGTLTFEVSDKASVGTPFDLASLTKPIATTTVVMDLVRTGALQVDEPVAALFADWRGADRNAVTVRDLLEHASGLPARLVDQPPPTRREFEHDIGAIPLEYPPRTRSIYSDLGFILLGFAAADSGGAPLDQLFDRIIARLTADSAEQTLTFSLAPHLRAVAAPTRPIAEDSRRGRLLAGEVHDNYAAALGGVAGHAGLFATAPAVGSFARAMLRAAKGDASVPPFLPTLVGRFIIRGGVPGSSRALGWDTMLPTSSCGTRMSPHAFGHVGFTGTSLWIDPAGDRYFVLLTNRVCGAGTLDQMRTVRRAFHDALGDP
jgi:CubicO group peptidase (beta-lactamase class C family)